MQNRILRALTLAAFAALGISAPAFAAGFDAKPQACISAIQSGSVGLATASGNSSISAPLSLCFSADLPYGTGTGQSTQYYAATRTLAANGNEDLDLSGTALKDPLGNSLACTKVHYLLVHAAATNAANITIKPGASNGFTGPFGAATHTQSIPATGWWAVAAPVVGWTVTAGTADLLNIANTDSGGSATYDIVVVCN